MKYKFVFLLLSGLFISGNVFSQWMQTNGPQGLINVSAIEPGSGETIVLTQCGLFYNDSIQGKWDYKASFDFNTFSKKGDTLFFGGYYSGIKLLDLSKPNNLPINNGLPEATILAINHSDTCLYAGIENGGFCKSIGFTKTWKSINTGLPADTIYIPDKFGGGVRYTIDGFCIEIKNNEIYCGTKNGVYKTNADSISWTSASIGLPKEKVNLIKCVDDTLFAFLNNKLFIGSGSDNWVEFFSSTSKITSINKFNGVFYVTTLGSGIFSSTDNGRNWSSMNIGLTDLNINNLNYINSVLVCGASTDGFYFYKDQKWNKNNTGIVCSTIISLTSNNSLLIAASDNRVYTSNDNNNWIDISSNTTFGYIYNVISTDANIFVSYANSSWEPFIKYYSIEKKAWYDMVNPNLNLALGEFYSIVLENNKLYVWTDKILSTNDLGLTWDVENFPDNWNQYKLFNTVELITPAGRNYEFTKNNWTVSNSGLPLNAEIFGFAKTTDALYVYVYAKGIYVSRDNGNSWTFANNGLNPDQWFTSYTFRDKNLYITMKSGVFYTDNYGQDWHSLNQGLINKNANGIIINNDTLYVGIYGNGVWKHNMNNIPLFSNDFSGDNGSLKIFPNPAKTNIEIQTGDVDYGELKIFDIAGNQIFFRMISTNETIDVSGIKNGIYLLNFIVKNKSYSTRLIINR